MRLLTTLVSKEIAHGLDSHYAYVLAAVFAVAFGLPAFWIPGGTNLFITGQTDLKPLFATMPLLFMVLIPALTMRVWTAERATGTFELLATWPISPLQLVLSKFLGQLALLAVALVALVPIPLMASQLGDLDWGPVFGVGLGSLSLGAAAIALCLAVGSVGRDPIQGFLGGWALLGLWMVLPIPALNGMAHFQNLARGIFDLRDLVFYWVVAGLGLWVSTLVWMRQRARVPGRAVFLPLGILILLAATLTQRLPRFDLTEDRLYSLNPASLALLAGLSEPVRLDVFLSPEVPPRFQAVVDLAMAQLEAYRDNAPDKVTLQVFDPESDPAIARQAEELGLAKTRANIYTQNRVETIDLWFGLVVRSGDHHEVFPSIQAVDNLEYNVSAALFRMTRARKPRLLLVGPTYAEGGVAFDIERDLKPVAKELEGFFEVRQVKLQPDSVISFEACDAVFAWSLPHFSESQLYQFDQYLVGGGSALILASGTHVAPNLLLAQAVPEGLADQFYAHLGFKVNRDLVCDQSCTKVKYAQSRPPAFEPYPLFPVLTPETQGFDPAFEATAQLRKVVMPWVSSLTVAPNAEGVTVIGRSSEQAWLQSPPFTLAPGQVPGPTSFNSFDLGLTLTRPLVSFFAKKPEGVMAEVAHRSKGDTPATLVVWGSEHVLTQTRDSANLVWALRTASYLTTRAVLTGVDRRENAFRPIRPVTDAEKARIQWASVIPVPLLMILLAGLRGWWRRRP